MPATDRTFSLLDALVLIATLALGFGPTRDTSALDTISDGLSIYIRSDSGQRINRGSKSLWVVHNIAPNSQMSKYWSLRIQNPIFRMTPCLATFTVAALALNLRRPRPPLRRLFRRPGVVAGVAVGMAIAAVAVHFPALLIDRGAKQLPDPGNHWLLWRMQIWFELPRLAGLCVAVGWLLFWLGGRWDAYPDWIDRLGRVLGACWIVMALMTWVSSWCFALQY